MDTNLQCIIIDDEPPAIRILEKYINQVTFLDKVGTFTSPIEALKFLQVEKVDLIFLDIQMPEISGIQLSKIIDKKNKIIFTTAYAQFAIESYEVAAIDYLLKPIAFDRFYKAISKIPQVNTPQPSILSTKDNFLFIKTDGKLKFSKVFIDNILYIEGLKNYISIFTINGRLVTHSTMKNVLEILPKQDFIQIHRSYILAIKHIDKIENDAVWINQKELSIGNTYRKSFFEKIAGFQL